MRNFADIEDSGAIAAPEANPWERGEHSDPPCVLRPEEVQQPGRILTPQGDLLFANLRGSFSAMAAQMGDRFAEPIRRGALPFYARSVDAFIERCAQQSRTQGVLSWAGRRWVDGRLEKQLPAEFHTAIRALAHGSGVEVETVLRAHLMPDTLRWMLTRLQEIGADTTAGTLDAMPHAGSASIIYRPPATHSILHAHNFNDLGIDRWDREAAVVFYHPDDGMDYLSVSSAGVLGGGIMAMNAAGITLTAHHHFPAVFDRGGVPSGVAGDLAMRRAHTIEQAIAILRDYPAMAPCTYMLCEGDTGRAAIYTAGPGRETLTWAGKFTRVLNLADQGLSTLDGHPNLVAYAPWRRAHDAQQQRLQALLAGLTRPRDEKIQPVDLARILADFTDPTTAQKRLFGPNIAAAHTLASVIFEPRQRRAWVATGVSPASCNWYVPFRLDAVDAHTGGPDVEAAPFIVDRGWHHSAHGQAFELYRKACARQREGESDGRLLILIEHALALFPHEPNLHALAGLLALRLGRARRAEGAFRRALEQIVDPARRSEVGLFLAWALDLREQRGAAKYLYKQIQREEASDARTQSRARQGRWVKFSAAQASRLVIDFTYAGVP